MKKQKCRSKGNNIKFRKNIILILALYVILFIFGFSVGGEFSYKKNLTIASNISTSKLNNSVNGQNHNEKKDNENIAYNKGSADIQESSKGNKMVNDDLSTDCSVIDVYKPDGHKVAYLTFDDGPSANITPSILSILKKNNIKATFFIIGEMAVENSNILKMEAADGNSIANHTYSHDYKYIYHNANNFISDLNKCDATLKSILGNSYSSKLIRFPGGSFGVKMASFRKAALDAGYHYIDWNDLTGDADGQNISVTKLMSELRRYTEGNEHVVILMHDASAKKTTLEALPQVIEYLKSEGYIFKTLK